MSKPVNVLLNAISNKTEIPAAMSPNAALYLIDFVLTGLLEDSHTSTTDFVQLLEEAKEKVFEALPKWYDGHVPCDAQTKCAQINSIHVPYDEKVTYVCGPLRR